MAVGMGRLTGADAVCTADTFLTRKGGDDAEIDAVFDGADVAEPAFGVTDTPEAGELDFVSVWIAWAANLLFFSAGESFVFF
jgi:hypothetical protein